MIEDNRLEYVSALTDTEARLNNELLFYTDIKYMTVNNRS